MALSEHFRRHFGPRDHLYGVLFQAMADDLDAGGIVASICRNHLDAPRSGAVQLRLLAGVFRVVLRGDAPQLERFYPALGGTADASECWPVMRDVLTEHEDELRRALDLPPQTNEPGRAACLAVGLFHAVRRSELRQIRLLEIGASGGLNLHVDRYRIIGPGWSWGDAQSPLLLDTRAANARPETLQIVARRGCDLQPVDASSPDGARYLTSFVWPFDLDRHARLEAALRVAAIHPVRVDRASASQWLQRHLAEPMPPEVLTVVWQSITRQYWRPLPKQPQSTTSLGRPAPGCRSPTSRWKGSHLRMAGTGTRSLTTDRSSPSTDMWSRAAITMARRSSWSDPKRLSGMPVLFRKGTSMSVSQHPSLAARC
ncbi:DUF2332 domain-containing protein [Janibacter sp. GXQ6167]|uniref:DUF2332 domain-containing protein n=1 Tax=Janibacter sp. GXQ6167 TaxID=3240791 RepID=UPI00352582C2